MSPDVDEFFCMTKYSHLIRTEWLNEIMRVNDGCRCFVGCVTRAFCSNAFSACSTSIFFVVCLRFGVAVTTHAIDCIGLSAPLAEHNFDTIFGAPVNRTSVFTPTEKSPVSV